MSMAIGGNVGASPATPRQANQAMERLLQQENQQSRVVQQLETQQQSIQDQLLQLESDTDSAANAEETKEALEKQLEKITEKLETAQTELERVTSQLSTTQAQGSAAVTESVGPTPAVSARRRVDVYESGDQPTPSAGLYQLQLDEENGYQIIFKPADE